MPLRPPALRHRATPLGSTARQQPPGQHRGPAASPAYGEKRRKARRHRSPVKAPQARRLRHEAAPRRINGTFTGADTNKSLFQPAAQPRTRLSPQRSESARPAPPCLHQWERDMQMTQDD